MKHDLALLAADIEDELSNLQKVWDEFQPFIPMLEATEEEVSSYDKIVVGYLLHSFYNGCENIFLSVARFFENDIQSGAWHKDLLKRMKLEIHGYRPALISHELYRQLDDFRGFRHRFRHAYGFELDWERERVVARKMSFAFSLLKSDVEVFFEKLKPLQAMQDEWIGHRS